MDVKSLFKSGKKTIKAFKVSTGPSAETKEEVKLSETPLEAWEPANVTTPAPAVNVNVGVEDYKAEADQSALKPAITWSQEDISSAAVVEEKPSISAYVPPSQRRAESSKAMPSVAEAATKLSGSAVKPAAAPTRLKLITSASKKAIEDEERKKMEDKKRKEAEKQARKEELKVELGRQPLPSAASLVAPSTEIFKAAPMEEIYAKYVNRPKTGRKLAVLA